MQASIATSADLAAWANRNLGWSQNEAVAHLEEKFGKLTSQQLGEYSERLYNQTNGGNGHKPEEEEAVKEAA